MSAKPAREATLAPLEAVLSVYVVGNRPSSSGLERSVRVGFSVIGEAAASTAGQLENWSDASRCDGDRG